MEKRLDEKGLAPFIVVIALLVVVSTGVAYWRVSRNSKSSTKNTLTSQKADLPKDLSGLLSVDKIKELTIAEKADATIKQVELEMINDVLVYKVQLLDGTLFAFNAKDGTKVTLSTEEKSETEEDNLPSDVTVTITFEKAIETAKSKYSDKTVRKVELELEAGKVVYSVRFTDGSRVDVDATTGEITQAKDSVVEDKDKNDNGIEDDKESESDKNSNTTATSTSGNKVEDKKSENTNVDSSDQDDDDKKEDEIEFKKSDSSKKDD